MRARHGAYYRQMATEAHDGLRGATGPIWRDRLASESGNLRAALDWFIATGDADAALSLASGIAWFWFINGDFAEGARWLGDALGASGQRHPGLGATAHVWHGYCVGMSSRPAAGVVECEEAVAALRRQDLIQGLELCHPCAQRSQLREIQDLRRAGYRCHDQRFQAVIKSPHYAGCWRALRDEDRAAALLVACPHLAGS